MEALRSFATIPLMTLNWYKDSCSTPDAFQHVVGYKPTLELVQSRTRLNVYSVDIRS